MNFNKYKIRESLGDIEAHEVFLDTLAHQKEEQFGLSEKKFEVKIKEKTLYLIFGLFFVVAAILFGKTFYFQVFQGKQLYLLSESNKGRIDLLRPERGIIYDKNLKKLVSNSPSYDFVCDKRNFLVDKITYEKQIERMALLLGKDFSEIETQIEASEESKVLIASGVDQQTILVLEARAGEMPDCQLEKNTIRNYALGPIFSPVLGYMGRINKDELNGSLDEGKYIYASHDNIGKDGLEKTYEDELRGIPGKTETIKTAEGIKKGDSVLSGALQGYNLVLNIDATLQQLIYKSLEQRLHDIGAKRGAAVAMNPQTGAVLAMVSYPSYDDNMFSKGISQTDFNTLINDPNNPLFNRAIAARYPTGSIIKPLEAAAALQEKIISPDKQINDPGYILIHNQYDPSITYRFGGVKPHGLVDMREAIAVSSNIYFYTVGGGYGDQQGLGPTRIKQYLSSFGWDAKTGVDLPGEFGGFIPDPNWKKQTKGQSWWDGDTYNLSIGQSDLQTTPLQVAAAYCAIANGGTLYKPQVVDKITDSSSGKQTTVQEFKPEIINQSFIDPQNLEIVREGMRDAVNKPYGLSAILNDLPVAVAAKTGTAQIATIGKYNLWSAAFAPYDNPEIVIVVTAEEVNALGAVTLPVAHDALQYYFSKK